MPGELIFSTSVALGFLLTVVRLAGFFLFVPLPGGPNIVSPARMILVVGTTIALYPQWPRIDAAPPGGTLLVWILVEATMGVTIGICVGIVTEVLIVGAHIMGLQAGYAFASTINPSTQADSTVLATIAELTGGLLFFSTGLHYEVLRSFASSLETQPAGSFHLTKDIATQVVSLGCSLFATGLRLALPVVAILIMVDISLALVGRVNAQLQLLTIALPVKMMLALALLGWLAMCMPALFRSQSMLSLSTVRRVMGL